MCPIVDADPNKLHTNIFYYYFPTSAGLCNHRTYGTTSVLPQLRNKMKLLIFPGFFLLAVEVTGLLHRHGTTSRRFRSKRLHNDFFLRTSSDKNDSNSSLEASTRLSHVMLKVQSVEDAVAYWLEKGAKVLQSRTDAEGAYQSAFVALGNGKTTEDCFSLELVRTDNFKLGNVINYLGVSLLLQFQGNLKGLISGEKKAKDEGKEPHGLPVKSVASSPGDFLCRLCLKSNNLEDTQAFYEDLLGLEIAAGDESQLCLRYGGYDKSNGVPTTLVFEGTNEKLDHGTCLDHLALKTTVSVNALFERFQNESSVSIYMKPTEMFGMTVMGLKDPNGYKIVIAGPF